MQNCFSIDYIKKPICSRYTAKNCSAKIRFGSVKNTDKYTFFHRMFFHNEIKKASNEREILAGKETIFGTKIILKHSVLDVDNSTTCR